MSGKNWERFFKLEAVSSFIQSLGAWIMGTAFMTVILGWAQSVPMILWLPSFVLTACGAIYIHDRFLASKLRAVSSSENANFAKLQKHTFPSVKFYFLSDWHPPFHQRHFKEGYTEELWVHMKADGNLSNLKIKIEVKNGNKILSNFTLESELEGDVPKGLEEKLLVFTREWRWQSHQVRREDHPEKDLQTLYRIDFGSRFFEHLPHKLEATTGTDYRVKITALHADGPNVAEFTVRNVDFGPAAQVKQIQNVETNHKVSRATFGDAFLG